MAKRRMLDQRISKSGKLSDVSWAAECIWYRILPHVDDKGNLTSDPRELRATVIPLGKKGKALGLKKLEGYLDELEGVGLIVRYEVDGQSCLHFVKFNNFQTLRGDRGPVLEWPEMPKDIPRHDSDIPRHDADTPVVNHDMLASRAGQRNGTELKGTEDAHTREGEPETDPGALFTAEASRRRLADKVGKSIPPEMIADAQDETVTERRAR